jgi:hypothetical protein
MSGKQLLDGAGALLRSAGSVAGSTARRAQSLVRQVARRKSGAPSLPLLCCHASQCPFLTCLARLLRARSASWTPEFGF